MPKTATKAVPRIYDEAPAAPPPPPSPSRRFPAYGPRAWRTQVAQLSVAEVARRSGYSASYIRRIESEYTRKAAGDLSIILAPPQTAAQIGWAMRCEGWPDGAPPEIFYLFETRLDKPISGAERPKKPAVSAGPRKSQPAHRRQGDGGAYPQTQLRCVRPLLSAGRVCGTPGGRQTFGTKQNGPESAGDGRRAGKVNR